MGPNQSHHYSRVRIFTGNSFSENMPAVQGVWYYCLIGLVCFRFLFPPLFFVHQSLLTKGHIDSSRPRARHTVTVVRSLGKPGTVFSGAGWLLCTLWKGHSCCACSGFLDSHPELSDCLLKPCEQSWAQRVRRCESSYMITRSHTHSQPALPIEATSVRALLRLQHKRWVQVKPNVCQMLRLSHQEVSLTLECCCWSGRVESSASLTRGAHIWREAK